MRYQHTIIRPVSCSGVGLHTGQPVSMTLIPAPPDTGVVFVHQQAGGSVNLSASIRNLMPSELCTALTANGILIKTVEHLLAALTGLEVDNVYVELDGGEVPAMDGSSSAFVRLIRSAGVTAQECRQPYLKILKPIEVSDGNRRVAIEPASTTKVTYSIQYNHPLIQRQTYVYDWSVAAFERDIAGARTFAFLKEVEALWSRGLAKGGSLDNTIVLSDDGLVNESGLRYQDEFVRHKILDLIGDLALLGLPFIGHLTADRSGHALHSRLVESILAQPESWVLVNPQDARVAVPMYAPTAAPLSAASALSASPAV